MSSREDRLLLTKQRLCTTLGDAGTKAYMSNLKMWFRKFWTKEQFDLECRKLLTPEQKYLHNEFFLAILNKITWSTLPQNSMDDNNLDMKSTAFDASTAMTKSIGGSGSSGTMAAKKRKRNPRTISERSNFEPIDLFDYLPEEDLDYQMPTTPLPQPRYAAQELFLPDSHLILGRILVAAWENDLSSADDNVCELIVLAVQYLLKNILTAILKARKHHRVTNGGNFFYDIGIPLKDPFLRNTATRQIIDDHPFEIDKEIASTNMTRRFNDDSIFMAACEDIYNTPITSRITLLDLYNALQDRNVIPCHSVYANNIERITQMLN